MTDEELHRVKSLPACRACGKQSDGAVLVAVVDREVRGKGGVLQAPAEERVFLCGTDYDAWKHSPEGRRSGERNRLDPEFNDFVTRRQAEARNGVRP